MNDTRTSLAFFGGLKAIGGARVIIECGEDRVILDFGLSYDPEGDIFAGAITPRCGSLLHDYIRLGKLPAIDGIYRGDELAGFAAGCLDGKPDLKGAEEWPGETAVFISHLHLDHMAGMGQISESIPVYLTQESWDLYQALSDIGEGVPGGRGYAPCQYDQSLRIGEIEVTPLRVEHDLPGAAAYQVKTPEGTIVYSGDLRLHGLHDWTQGFIRSLQEEAVDVLILETTTIPRNDELVEQFYGLVRGEEDLAQSLEEILTDVGGLAICNIYHRNVDRLAQFISAAGRAGRKMALEPATAYLLNRLRPELDFLVYKNEEMQRALAGSSQPDWQGALLSDRTLVDFSEINRQPADYFIQNSYLHCLELLDFNLKDSVYIHSGGIPLGSFDPEYVRLTNYLAHLQVDYLRLDCTGHAVPADLQRIVELVDPPVLIPIHGLYPERLQAFHGRRLLPEEGKQYSLTELIGRME